MSFLTTDNWLLTAVLNRSFLQINPKMHNGKTIQGQQEQPASRPPRALEWTFNSLCLAF
jgi:hypothetical protein